MTKPETREEKNDRRFVDTGLVQDVRGHEFHVLLCCDLGDREQPSAILTELPEGWRRDGVYCDHCSGPEEVRHPVISFIEGLTEGWIDAGPQSDQDVIVLGIHGLMRNTVNALDYIASEHDEKCRAFPRRHSKPFGAEIRTDA